MIKDSQFSSTSRTTVSDNNLPGLGIALTRDTFLEMLAENLPECRNGLQLLDARILDVQYAPGSSAQVLWKLKIRDPERRGTGRQLVFVKALRKDDPAPEDPAGLVRRYNEIRGQK